MAFGKVTKLDSVASRKRSTIQEKTRECTDEELIDSGIPFILQRCGEGGVI